MRSVWLFVPWFALGCRAEPPVGDSAPEPAGTLATSADVLDFGALRAGETATQPLDLTNVGEGDLALWDVAFSEDGMRAHWQVAGSTAGTIAPGASTRLEVIFAPLAVGDLGFVLQALSDDPEARVREVELRGQGIGTPRIVVSPAALDFGLAPLGSAVEAEVVVANHGDADLHLGAVTIADGAGDFALTVDPSDSVLAAGEETGLAVVRFEPQAVGPVAGALAFASDDPASPLVEVPLGGEGAVPSSR